MAGATVRLAQNVITNRHGDLQGRETMNYATISKPSGLARSFQDEAELDLVNAHTQHLNLGMITAHRNACSAERELGAR